MSDKHPPPPPASETGRHSFTLRVPHGDSEARHVCDTCGFINYVNPKIVVGSVVRWSGAADGRERIVMCKRAIEPRTGFWTLPAGYMELGETAAEGAMREAREEACATIRIDALLAVYSIPRISQVQLMHLATLVDPAIEPGPESLDVALVTWDEIPWNDLAFPSVRWALDHYDAVRQLDTFPPFTNPDGATGDMR